MMNSVNGQRMSISVENTFSRTSTVTLAQKLDAWVSATPAGGDEQRDVAAARITEAHASNCANLDLACLGLTSLPKGVFSELKKLTELFLEGNQLISLPDKIFEGLSGLTALSLKDNQLISLPDKAFEGLSSLTNLSLAYNQLTSLPDNAFEGLSSLTALFIAGNQFIFKPVVPSSIRVSIESNLRTLDDEFEHGNQALLSFNLNSENIPGTINAQGLFKLELMLQHANQKIVSNDTWAWENSGVLNQLLYQASHQGNIQSEVVTTQAQMLLTAYLNINNIKEFAEQVKVIGLAPDQYEAFIFVTKNGVEGLTILKDCYETHILSGPFANKDAPNSALVNGILIHQEGEDATTLKSPDQLKPFALLNQAYIQTLNQQDLGRLFTSMNMVDEYKQRFTELLTVQSASVLAHNRGTTEAERVALLSSYKMVDAHASTRLFAIFSELVNQSTDLTIDRLANPAAAITDAHFADICRALSGFQETRSYALTGFLN